MRSLAPILFGIALSLGLLQSGCGPSADERYRDRLLPLVPGAIWDYRTSDATGAPGARTVRVLGREDGYLVLETHENGRVVRTYLEEAPLLLAVREIEQRPGERQTEQVFNPGALRGLSRADLRAGQVFERQWVQEQGGVARQIAARWTVEAVGVQVLGDFGAFDDVVRIRREQSDGSDTVLWFAPGVGLVRSEGAEQAELVHWAIP